MTEWRARVEDVTAHLLALVLAGGFFSIILCSILGYVDLKDPTVATFLGAAAGYAAAKLDGPIKRYYGFEQPKEKRDADG